MKFECISAQLYNAVQQVSKARSKSSLNPLLQCLYLEVEDFNLIVRATNLEMVCEKSISIKGIQNGSCLINADTFVKVISLLNKNDTGILCEVIEGVLTITSGKDILEIKLFAQEDFPKLPKKGETCLKIEREIITKLIRDVSFSSATTDIKPDIASVFIYLKENVLYSVATDSYRLAESKFAFDGDDFSFLLPQKYTSDVLSVLDQEYGLLEISLSENLLTIETDTLTLSLTPVLGQFPDYKQLFPREFTTTMSLQKDDLQKTLTLSSFFTETYNTTNLIIEENTLRISSKNAHVGSMTKVLEGQKNGENIEGYYNNKYFLEVFSHFEGKEVTLSFTTKNRPLFITSNGSNSYTYLLMPVNK
jgi:DNA polymerase III subunit beta